MKIKYIKPILTVLFATLALSASLLAFSAINQSTAWFSNNKEVEANGLSVNVQTPESAKAAVTFYPAEQVSSGAVTFNRSTGVAATLPQYSLTDETTHYLLMEITASEACTLTISTTTTYILDSARPLLGGEGTGANYSNWISSILFFADVSEKIDSSTGAVTLGQATRQGFANPADYTFSNASITYSIAANTPLYIVIGYDNDLMSRLYSQNIGNDNLGGQNGIKYVNDCTFTVTLKGEVS